jgi:hypothetical protein
MKLRLPAFNSLGVCSRCWAAATPHNSASDGALADVPYLRVRFCETYDRVGDRVSSPLLVGDRFVVDGRRLVVKTAEVEKDTLPENDGATGHSWVWVIEAVVADGSEDAREC